MIRRNCNYWKNILLLITDLFIANSKLVFSERSTGMDIKAKVDEILEKVKGDEAFGAKFKENPVKAIEELTGADLPDEQIKGIAEGLKAKFALDKDGDGKVDILETIGEKAGGLGEMIGEKAGGLGGMIGEKAGDLGEKLGGLFKKD